MRGAFSFIWARTDISVRYAHITVFHSAVDFCIILSKGGITISIQENLAASIRFMMEVRRQSLTEISEKAEISRSMMQEYVKARGNRFAELFLEMVQILSKNG